MKKSFSAHSDALYLDQRELLSSSWLASILREIFAWGKYSVILKKNDAVI